MQEVIMIPVGKIIPDPNQPRKTFNEKEIQAIAKNMEHVEGHLINPIEVDETYMIITGERRWRAAKLLGLHEVRCVVLDIDEGERFFRQVSENIHHNTMTDYDTAVALNQLLSISHRESDKKHTSEYFDKGIAWLSSRLGRSTGWVHEKLSILKESKEVRGKLQEGKLSSRAIREANRAPEEYRDKLKKMYASGKIPGVDAIGAIASSLNENPHLVDKIMNFEGETESEIREYLKREAPLRIDKEREAVEESEHGKELWIAIGRLENLLKKWPPDSLGESIRPQVGLSIISLINGLGRYLRPLKQLEDEQR